MTYKMPEPLTFIAQFHGEWREALSTPAAEPVFTASQLTAAYREGVSAVIAIMDQAYEGNMLVKNANACIELDVLMTQAEELLGDTDSRKGDGDA